jgi:hypothetical protein
MQEKILYGTKISQPDYMEQIISTKPEQFEASRAWAKANGYDRLRVHTIDLSDKPDFKKTIR